MINNTNTVKKSTEIVQKYNAPALSRGLKILEILTKKQTCLTSRQIANELNINKGQTYRYLYVLSQSGYIERQGSEMFKISGKLFSLGIQYIDHHNFINIVSPIMDDIAKNTCQSCHCTIRVGSKIVVIAVSNSPFQFGFSVKVGYSKELELSTSGKVILAYLPDTYRNNLMKNIKQKYDTEFIKNLENDLETIRKNKYIIANSTYVEGILDMSVPIVPKISNIEPFAISIPFVSSSDNVCTKEDAVTILINKAKEISKILV
jgi:DNA-binding IclR family transcriptional regulator